MHAQRNIFIKILNQNRRIESKEILSRDLRKGHQTETSERKFQGYAQTIPRPLFNQRCQQRVSENILTRKGHFSFLNKYRFLSQDSSGSEMKAPLEAIEGHSKTEKALHSGSVMTVGKSSVNPLNPHPHAISGTIQTSLPQGGSSLQQSAGMSTEWRSINPAATKEVKLFYFDTLGLTNKFHAQGFTREQSVCLVEAFVEVLNNDIEHNTKNMVTKPQQEIMVQQLLSLIEAVKKDMVILEKSEFTMLRNENEKQAIEIKQLKVFVKDEIQKLTGHIKLDINLERSRSTEAHAENEKQLQILRNKIDTDVANIKTTHETYKNDVTKLSIGAVLSVGTIMLGVMRLMS